MKTKSQWVTMRIDPELLEKIDRMAAKEERSRSNMMSILLKKAVAQTN